MVINDHLRKCGSDIIVIKSNTTTLFPQTCHRSPMQWQICNYLITIQRRCCPKNRLCIITGCTWRTCDCCFVFFGAYAGDWNTFHYSHSLRALASICSPMPSVLPFVVPRAPRFAFTGGLLSINVSFVRSFILCPPTTLSPNLGKFYTRVCIWFICSCSFVMLIFLHSYIQVLSLVRALVSQQWLWVLYYSATDSGEAEPHYR